ncbi:MAG: tRNA (adenosine(37)-N6)-dimethylallyltransferase MiaA, partial [Firmicutes bacterium]|nr:tRNA (adenosine(37)-N6)-dimethylallyltransferase MiaA [Bacillota bacterium]
MSSLPSRIAILGPTASGKSALGAEVARRLGGIVVNGDPFQAYEGLAIGTGQPTAEEQGEIGHVGYGLLPLSATLNPASFGAQVRAWMGEGPAVLVTGSGLYLRGIWEQLDVLPEVDEALVARTRRWGQTMPGASLHRYLCAVDPLRAQQLHPKDRSRLQRALALHLASGKRPSELLRGVERGLPEGWKALVVRPS